MYRLTMLLVALVLALMLAAPAGAATYGYAEYTEIDAAIDYYGLPPIFHDITARESGDGADLYNEWSGACGYFQFMPDTAALMGTNCYALSDPYIAAREARELYDLYRSMGYTGLEPWSMTAY